MTEIETTRKLEGEMKKAFAEMFPLVDEHQLPWAACQIKGFLKGRIEYEVRSQVSGFVSQASRVLCEATLPKTHFVDMCRNLVNEVISLRRVLGSILDEANGVMNTPDGSMSPSDARLFATGIAKKIERVKESNLK